MKPWVVVTMVVVVAGVLALAVVSLIVDGPQEQPVGAVGPDEPVAAIAPSTGADGEASDAEGTPENGDQIETLPLRLQNPGPGRAGLVAYSHRVARGSGWPGLRDIHVIDAASGRNWTVATGLEVHDDFRWSPDGSMIAIAARDGIHVAARDGSGSQQVLRGARAGLVSWHPDGEHLIYAGPDAGPLDPGGLDRGHMFMLHDLESGEVEQVAIGTLCAITTDARRLLYAQMTSDLVKDDKGMSVSNTRLVVRDLESDGERSYVIPEGLRDDRLSFF